MNRLRLHSLVGVLALGAPELAVLGRDDALRQDLLAEVVQHDGLDVVGIIVDVVVVVVRDGVGAGDLEVRMPSVNRVIG
jgi:hypothetical protein